MSARNMPKGVVETIWQNIVNAPPSRTALCDSSLSLTYKQLEEETAKVACLLDSEGVSQGDCVAVVLPRTALLPLTLLSILLKGMKYVYLEPTYPDERLKKIVARSKARLVLGDAGNLQRFQDYNAKLISFDQLKTLSSHGPLQGTESAGYLMFTSGTTGEPKGIFIQQKRMTAYLHSIAARMELRGDDCYLHTAPFATSASVRQFLLPLLSQATLAIASESEIADPQQIAELIIKKKVTVIDGVQPYWQRGLALIESRGQKSFFAENSVRLMGFSGGILSFDFIRELRQRWLYSGEIINIYGQTETIGVSTFRIPPNLEGQTGIVPIGKPYRDIDFYIDEDGELNVSMEGLPSGYLDTPSTAFYTLEKDGEKRAYYRTGDVVSLEGDGLLYIKGRRDDQVKIHGMRVELAEVETHLRGMEEILDVVTVQDSEQLIAYITIDPVSTVKERSLLQEARKLLPRHMVPAQFRLLPDLPRLPNQKIDRKAFKSENFYSEMREDFDDAFRQQVRRFTGDQLEKDSDRLSGDELKKIWQRILKRSSVGRDDDFFQLGGDSLAALELLVEIKKKLGVELTVEQVFSNSVLGNQIELLEKNKYKELKNLQWATLVHQGTTDRLLLWCGNFKPFWRQFLREYTIYSFKNYYSPEASYSDDPDSVEEMAAFYVDEIRQLQPEGPYFLGGFSFAGVVAYEVARLLRESKEEVAVFFLDPAVSVSLPGGSVGSTMGQAGDLKVGDRHSGTQADGKEKSGNSGAKEKKSVLKRILDRAGWFLELAKLLPARVNYRLCAKGLLNTMYFGDHAFFAEEKHLAMMNRYTIQHIDLSAFLVQTSKFAKRQNWCGFFGDSCKRFRKFDTSHSNLGNKEEYVNEWAKEVKEMFIHPCWDRDSD